MAESTYTYNSGSFKVNITIPDDVAETIRQQKIERLYEILRQKDDEDEDNSA